MLTPIEPYPPHGGWQTVIYNDAKFLAARGHEVKILSRSYDPGADPSDVSDFAEAEYFPIRKRPRWRQVLANMGQALPYTVARHNDEAMMARACELVGQGFGDIVLVQDVVMGTYAERIRRVSRVPLFLRSHNVSTKIVERFYQTRRNPLMRCLGRRQYVKFDRFERAIWNEFDGVAQISPIDAKVAQGMEPGVRQEVLYAGIDLGHFSVGPAEKRDSKMIVHVGGGGLQTSMPGLIWFRERVFPLIKKRCPEARLEFVGRMPQPPPFRVGDDVIVHGFVDEVLPYLHQAAVFVVPLFVGGGIRIKILNALATGNAIVSTPVGCEGLPVVDGEHLLVAEKEKPFADCVCRLLEAPALRKRLCDAGRALVERQFSWPRIAAELERLLREAMRRSRHEAEVGCEEVVS